MENCHTSFILAKLSGFADQSMPTFRIARRADAAAILALYKSLVGMPGCAWDAEYPNADTIASDLANNALYLFCDENKAILAVATLLTGDELGEIAVSWDDRITRPCELSRIGVTPTLQRRGMGSALLEHIFMISYSKGYDGMRLLVAKTNPAANALYRKYNFVLRGKIRIFNNDFYAFDLFFDNFAKF